MRRGLRTISMAGDLLTTIISLAIQTPWKLQKIWENLANRLYSWRIPGSYPMAFYGGRQPARHFLLVTRLMRRPWEPRWQTDMTMMANLWLQSPDWDVRGFYAEGSGINDGLLFPPGYNPYQLGVRGNMHLAFSYYLVPGSVLRSHR